MANHITTSQEVLNAFALHLENNLIAAKAVTTGKYDAKIDATNGLEVQERVPSRAVSKRTVGGVASYTRQDTLIGTERVRVNQTLFTSMGFDDFERIKSYSNPIKSNTLKSRAIALASDIDAMILDCALGASSWVGTPANPVDDPEEFDAAITRLTEHNVEESDLLGVLTYSDRQKLNKYIRELPGPDGASTQSLRTNKVGQLSGHPVMFTQQLRTLVAGTAHRGNTQTDGPGAVNYVDYEDVKNAAQQGWYKTMLLNVENAGSGATFVKGEVFTIAGVYAYDPVAQQRIDRLQEFVIVEDAAAVSTADVELRIYPAIIPAFTAVGVPNTDANRAHATVELPPANDVALTFKTAASAMVKPRLLIQKQAIILSSAELTRPFSDTVAFQTLEDVPITVRMWSFSDGTTGAHEIRFDCAVDVNIMDRNRIVKFNGA